MTECLDPYAHHNYANWDILSWPEYSYFPWTTIYAYIPGETHSAEAAKYTVSHIDDVMFYPDEMEYAFYYVDQSALNDQWIHFSGWHPYVFDVGGNAWASCPADQEMNFDDIIGRHCYDLVDGVCEDTGFPTGGFSPECGPTFD